MEFMGTKEKLCKNSPFPVSKILLDIQINLSKTPQPSLSQGLLIPIDQVSPG